MRVEASCEKLQTKYEDARESLLWIELRVKKRKTD